MPQVLLYSPRDEETVMRVTVPPSDQTFIDNAIAIANRKRSFELPFTLTENSDVNDQPVQIPTVLSRYFLDGSYNTGTLASDNPLLSIYISTIVTRMWQPFLSAVRNAEEAGVGGYTQVGSLVRLMCMQWSFGVPTTEACECLCRWAARREHLDRNDGDAFIVEIGAGTGYWAALTEHTAKRLGKRVSVICFDNDPPDDCRDVEADMDTPLELNSDKESSEEESVEESSSEIGVTNKLGYSTSFHPILPGGPTRALHYFKSMDNSTSQRQTPTPLLFLCWPPLASSMAERALDAFPHSRVAYVGPDIGSDGRAVETNGDLLTATPGFFEKLGAGWTMVDVIRLPGWYTGGNRDALFVCEPVKTS
ncbi:hypothetical protein M427DRAFT_51686 [Gonapodya prolifera JEL478]|uniref:Uncharacterized protein n=1 Tax=Gonapodya prolifera (strain JEL478) TaxID=1344416 RepID=A0A139AVD3_GONPJ|nr:hypothetical protein M427DRAFT_51686 [Gonapodya prolifera JEL478]|eukprot:KXS20706.1 hypothetical protein M427DRAFT_51686 [Gonapodya prolifera JEL478]